MHQIDYDLNIDEICKIEGEAGLEIKVRAGKVEDIKFKIQEYKRFFSQGIVGKSAIAAPQFLARICGTCSNAHILASSEAVEKALGVQNTKQTDILKKLMINGLMIRDHALHLYIFALPDIFNRDSLMDFDENDPTEHQFLHDALKVKSAGNKLQVFFAGRSVHAPFAGVGGFTKIPTEDPKQFIPILEDARPAVLRLINIFNERMVEFERKTHLLAIRGNDGWNFLEGVIKTTCGNDIAEQDMRKHLDMKIIPYSQARGYQYKGDSLMVGALARLYHNRDQLHERTKKDIKNIYDKFSTINPYMNNVAQAIEILHSIDETIDILENLKLIQEPRAIPTAKDGKAVGVIEAPRGLLYYNFEIENQIIKKMRIVIPTAINQINIERDIGKIVEENIDMNREELVLKIEKLIRAYDPCMSCASHFLKVKWDIA